MFNFFKRLHRSAAFASNSAAARLYWNNCFVKAAGRAGARHYDVAFWQEVAYSFADKWREIEPVSRDPAQLLEQRLGVYLSFLKDTILEQAKCGNLTTDQLEEVGVFVARASVLDLREAIMSDPEGVSPIFHLLPSAWLETAGVTPEQFDHCYLQRTGRHRAVQRLEDTVAKDLTDRVVAHMGRQDEQQAEQFVQDFKEHMVKSHREGPEEAHGPASTEQATSTMYYYADTANQTKGPVSLQGLLDLRSKAVIADATYVIEVGTQDWKPFSSVLPPPVPPRFGGSVLAEDSRIEFCLSRARGGDAAAQCEMGFYYYTGQAVPKDYGEAVKWFFSAAQQGHAVAQCNLGLCRAFGRGIPQSYTEAVSWFTKAAEQGDVHAAAALGLCYYGALGVGRDDNAAIKWLLHAGQQGSAQAQRTLGLCYTFGTGVRKSLEEAFEWTRRAAEQGLVPAQTMLGICYTKGQGVPRNDSKGIKWLRRAAEQGDRSAQTILGGCYQRGDGVTKDHKEAATWFRSAAEQGYAPAQCALGFAYYRGEGLAQDNDEAAKWLSRAAEQGFAAAQAELASCYIRGHGVRMDFAEAYRWLSLAAAQGDRGAKSRCATTSIPSDQTAEGRRRAGAFVPKKENPVDEVERDLPRVRQS